MEFKIFSFIRSDQIKFISYFRGNIPVPKLCGSKFFIRAEKVFMRMPERIGFYGQNCGNSRGKNLDKIELMF